MFTVAHSPSDQESPSAEPPKTERPYLKILAIVGVLLLVVGTGLVVNSQLKKETVVGEAAGPRVD